MGKGLGAQYILTGSFIVMGDAFRVDARLINVENGEIVFSKAVDGNKIRDDTLTWFNKLTVPRTLTS